MPDERERFLIRYAGGFAPFTVARAEGAWVETTDGRRILDTGSEANEVALKLAKLRTGRFEVAGLARSFHGLLAGVASVNFSMGHTGYGPLLPGAFALPAPYAYRCPIRHCDGACDCTCLEAGFELLDQQSVGSLAAFIAEPVLSTGGIVVPPEGYFRRARELCDERGMLLVLDEAQTCLGRLGTMFAFELDGVVPDLLSLSKTLGGGVPLAATVTSAEIAADCEAKGFLHVTSHVSDPLPAAAGLAVLDVIEEEGLVGRARERGEYLISRLRELQERHEQIGDVRGRGLLVGLELVSDRDSKTPADALGQAVTGECIARGLSMNIVRAGRFANCLRMAPPLTVSEAEIDTAAEILDESLRAVLAG